MQIRLAAIGYDGTEAFHVETDTTEDLPFAIIAAAEIFGKEWNDHFDGVSRTAAIMAAFAIGVAIAGKNEEPISYRGRDIIAGVRPTTEAEVQAQYKAKVQEYQPVPTERQSP